MMLSGAFHFCLVFSLSTAAPGPNVNVNIDINVNGVALSGDADESSSEVGATYIVSPTVDPVLEDVMCGLEALPSTRIVNGNNSRRYPWQVGIKNTQSSTAKFYCGGTFITKQHILTAAHCFFSECLVIPAIIYIGYGSIKQDQVTTIDTSSIVWHDKYNCSTYANDIAVITLSAPVVSMTPICLPGAGSSYDQESKGTIIGWGSTVGYNTIESNPPTNFPNVLQESQVPIISNALCNPLVQGNIKSTQICTSTGKGYNGDPKGSGTCQGDSGGPLVVSKTGTRNKQYVQIGITSNGRGCGAKNNPDVLTRVSKFLKFIQDNTKTETLYYLD